MIIGVGMSSYASRILNTIIKALVERESSCILEGSSDKENMLVSFKKKFLSLQIFLDAHNFYHRMILLCSQSSKNGVRSYRSSFFALYSKYSTLAQ